MFLGFCDGSAGKELACNAGDLGLIPGLGRSPGEGKGYPLLSLLAWRILWIVTRATNPPQSWKFKHNFIVGWPCPLLWILQFNQTWIVLFCASYLVKKKINLVGLCSSNLCCSKINCNKIWRSCILLLFYFVLLWSLMEINVSTLCRFQLGYFSFSWKDSDPFILGYLSYFPVEVWTWIVTFFLPMWFCLCLTRR